MSGSTCPDCGGMLTTCDYAHRLDCPRIQSGRLFFVPAAPSSSPTPTLEERKARAFDWLTENLGLLPQFVAESKGWWSLRLRIAEKLFSTRSFPTKLDAVEAAAMRLNSQKEQE